MNIQTQKIENVVYDLGGVLLDLDMDRCKAAFDSLGLHAIAEIISPFYPADMLAEMEVGRIDFHQTCERMRALAPGVEVTDEQISWAYGQFLIGIPEYKLHQIKELRQRGIKTYVLSNNNPESMKVVGRMFAEYGDPMESYFDKIYLSYQMGLLKPYPEIFQAMLADSGMVAQRTLFIDDGLKNVNTARELGFAVYHASEGEDFGSVLSMIQ